MNALMRRLFRKRQAYRRVFLRDDGELNEDAKVIMTDLAKFCRARGSTAMVSPQTGSIDPIAMAMAEGRREVFNRINEYLHINDNILQNLREEPVHD